MTWVPLGHQGCCAENGLQRKGGENKKSPEDLLQSERGTDARDSYDEFI